MTFYVNVPIKYEMIRSILCCAFEGGSNYWCSIKDLVYGDYSKEDFKEGGRLYNEYWGPLQILPITPGCSLILADELSHKKKSYVLDLDQIKKGLNVMMLKYPKHFADLISDSTDATTGDVFLQCCLFSELVYG